MVEIDLAGQPLAQQRRALIVQAAPPHIDGLDLRRGRALDGVVIAFADQEIIFDDGAERGHRQRDFLQRILLLIGDIEDQAIILETDYQAERTFEIAFGPEIIPLQQIVKSDRAFMLDLGLAPHEALFVKLDVDQPIRLRVLRHFSSLRQRLQPRAYRQGMRAQTLGFRQGDRQSADLLQAGRIAA